MHFCDDESFEALEERAETTCQNDYSDLDECIVPRASFVLG